MRHALPTILGLLLLILAPDPGAVRAEDEPPPATVQWIDGWEAGRAKAKERGTLIFLYFGRKTPT